MKNQASPRFELVYLRVIILDASHSATKVL